MKGGLLELDVAWPDLAVADRCDSCGAQAFVVTRHGTGQHLFWCGHHFGVHEPALLAAGAPVRDHRDRINKKASSSA